MALSQFDLGRLLRCQAMDEEGFSCVRPPLHDGGHRWDRCEKPDLQGHRCMLPLGHPGLHEAPWYDRASTPGARHTVNYDGTERDTGALADTATRIAARYGWADRSRTFTPGLRWRLALLRPWFARATVNGRLTVVFELRPTGS